MMRVLTFRFVWLGVKSSPLGQAWNFDDPSSYTPITVTESELINRVQGSADMNKDECETFKSMIKMDPVLQHLRETQGVLTSKNSEAFYIVKCALEKWGARPDNLGHLHNLFRKATGYLPTEIVAEFWVRLFICGKWDTTPYVATPPHVSTGTTPHAAGTTPYTEDSEQSRPTPQIFVLDKILEVLKEARDLSRGDSSLLLRNLISSVGLGDGGIAYVDFFVFDLRLIQHFERLMEQENLFSSPLADIFNQIKRKAGFHTVSYVGESKTGWILRYKNRKSHGDGRFMDHPVYALHRLVDSHNSQQTSTDTHFEVSGGALIGFEDDKVHNSDAARLFMELFFTFFLNNGGCVNYQTGASFNTKMTGLVRGFGMYPHTRPVDDVKGLAWQNGITSLSKDEKTC